MKNVTHVRPVNSICSDQCIVCHYLTSCPGGVEKDDFTRVQGSARLLRRIPFCAATEEERLLVIDRFVEWYGVGKSEEEKLEERERLKGHIPLNNNW